MNTTTQYYLLFITQLTYFLSFVPLSKYLIFSLLSVTWFALYMLSHFKKRFKTFKTIFSFHVWHMAGVYFIRENSPENPMFCRKKNRTANHCWKGNIACEARKKPLKEEEHREWNKDSEKSTTQLKNNYKECLSFSLIKHEIVVNQKCEWCTYCGIPFILCSYPNFNEPIYISLCVCGSGIVCTVQTKSMSNIYSFLLNISHFGVFYWMNDIEYLNKRGMKWKARPNSIYHQIQ